MSNITYSYEIVSVDQAARCMEVVYLSEGRQTMHISARLPFEGEDLSSVVGMYSPVAYWLEQERAVVPPPVGEKGSTSISLANNTNQANTPAALYNGADADKSAIDAFFTEKGIVTDVRYLCSMFNVTTGELLANLYGDGKNLAKALNGVVVEWYEADAVIDGVKYAYVSKNVQSGEILDKYIVDQRGLVKFTQDPNENPTITTFGSLATIPPMLKASVADLPFKERITGWSLKSYGFIVEFARVPGDISESK